MSDSPSPLPTPARPPAGVLLLLMAAGVWIVVAALLMGPLLTQDSEAYVVLADSLAHQHTYALPYVEATPLSLQHQGQGYNPPPWPPAYPAVTALLMLITGLSAQAAAWWLAIAAAVVCVFLVYSLCRSLGCSPWLAAIGAACFAVAPGTAIVVPRLWSETLFLVPLLIVLTSLSKERDLRWQEALSIGLLTAAAALARYAAVGLILTVAVCLLRRTSREPLARRSGLLLLAAGVPTAAMAGWFIRNRLVTGTFEGFRPPACDGFLTNLAQALKSLAPVFLGQHHGKAALVAVLAISLVALAAMWIVQRQRGTLRPAAGTGIFCALVFIAGHVLWTTLARTMTGFEPIQVRYVWPVLPAALAIGLALLQQLVAASRRPVAPAVAGALALVAILACGLLTVRTSQQTEGPAARQAAEQRMAVAQSPEVKALLRGKTVLFVETWPLTMRELATSAAKVWYMSPYSYTIHDFTHPGAWRDWERGIDAIVALTPLPAGGGAWNQRVAVGTASVYVRTP